LATWLYSLGGIDIHAQSDFPFRMACNFGHLSVAKWLYSLDSIDIHINNEAAFRGACLSGHLSVAQWLSSLGEIDVHANQSVVFLQACKVGHFSIVQWLYHNFSGFEVSMELLKDACHSGHIELAYWLWSQIKAGMMLMTTSSDLLEKLKSWNSDVSDWLFNLEEGTVLL
jgi:hypothetical protein